MPIDPLLPGRLRAAVELASEAVADMEAFNDPTLWRGPAATAFRLVLGDRRTWVRAALGAARTAADELDAEAAAGG